jgi:hypothetical protein
LILFYAAIFADFRAISILPHAAPPCLMPASRQRAVIASAIDCRFRDFRRRFSILMIAFFIAFDYFSPPFLSFTLFFIFAAI